MKMGGSTGRINNDSSVDLTILSLVLTKLAIAD